MRRFSAAVLLLSLYDAVVSFSFSGPAKPAQLESPVVSRRGALLTFGASILNPIVASAATDCMSDCVKNCKLIAPKDSAYCLETCKDYCAQDDRTDGLSGSVSSEGGEVGILGTSTVVKGEDKPPSISLPGLDFTSDKGKKLIGY